MIFFSLRGRIFSGVAIVLRLRTNTERTEHRTFYSSLNVRVNTTIHIATLRFSQDYHHWCNGNICTYCIIRTYVHCYVHWYLGYVQIVMYVSVHALLLHIHLIEWPYCGRILSMMISIANSYIQRDNRRGGRLSQYTCVTAID